MKFGDPIDPRFIELGNARDELLRSLNLDIGRKDASAFVEKLDRYVRAIIESTKAGY